MRREIKFRAWDYQLEGWVGQYDPELGLSLTFPINDYFIDDGKEIDRWDFMQYTGLKDKNGKEIYEGDIIALTGWAKMKDGSTFTVRVVWFEQIAGFVVMNLKNNGIPTSMKTLTVDGEVIGNIYENPELI